MTSIISTGPLVLALLLAVAAGTLSFASPCVLPLVPGFLGYVTGLTGQDLAGHRRTRLVGGAVLFVAGFSAVYILGAVIVSAAGLALQAHQDLLLRASGAIVALMGLSMLGAAPWPARAPRARPPAGLAGAPVLGAIFGLGWGPCQGPTLAAILTLASPLAGTTGAVGRGVLLVSAYCLGLGLPFVAIAAGYHRASTASRWLARHHRGLQRLGGAALTVIGVLMLTGAWQALVVGMQTSLIATFTTGL